MNYASFNILSTNQQFSRKITLHHRDICKKTLKTRNQKVQKNKIEQKKHISNSNTNLEQNKNNNTNKKKKYTNQI